MKFSLFEAQALIEIVPTSMGEKGNRRNLRFLPTLSSTPWESALWSAQGWINPLQRGSYPEVDLAQGLSYLP